LEESQIYKPITTIIISSKPKIASRDATVTMKKLSKQYEKVVHMLME